MRLIALIAHILPPNTINILRELTETNNLVQQCLNIIKSSWDLQFMDVPRIRIY